MLEMLNNKRIFLDKQTVDVAGLTLKINEKGKYTIYDIEDYRTEEELHLIIKETLKKHNGKN